MVAIVYCDIIGLFSSNKEDVAILLIISTNKMNNTVSIIITIFNGEQFIDDCFHSILRQQYIATRSSDTTTIINREKSTNDATTSIEVCVYDDASNDKTADLLQNWLRKFSAYGITLKVSKNHSGVPLGVGYGRNRSIDQSTGSFFCFQDIDDEMFPDRIRVQLEVAVKNQNAIVGSKFIRTPPNATCRYTTWANELEESKLATQVFTSHGPTIIMPTWFCHRSVYEKVGGFCEAGKGTPEDLIFFYKHLDLNGTIIRTNEVLLNYKYHLNATTFTVDKETIWKIRLHRLIETILCKSPWNKSFSIWNAGKQGRKLYRYLPDYFKSRVVAFCDVDANKINKTYNYFEEIKRKVNRTVPIVHFSNVKPPIVICMKLDLTKGRFEDNLRSLHLVEGKDYILFT